MFSANVAPIVTGVTGSSSCNTPAMYMACSMRRRLSGVGGSLQHSGSFSTSQIARPGSFPRVATRSATNGRAFGHAALSRHSLNLYCMVGITPMPRSCAARTKWRRFSQPLLVPLPRRIRDKDSYLIQLESRGVVQIPLRDRRIVLKPEFSVPDGLGRLIIESSYPAQILRHAT